MSIKSSINGLIKTILSFGKTNAPTLLTAGGIALGGATAVIIYKKSPEAHAKKTVAVAKARTEGKSKLVEKVEAAKATSKVLWPAYATGAASVFCLCKSNKISKDRLVATASACTFLEKKIEAMRETEKEVLGDVKAEDLKRKTYEKMMEKSKSDPDKPEEPKQSYAGLPQLYYDVLNDRFLRSNVDQLRAAENKVNQYVYREYIDGSLDDYVGPNEFYEAVGWNPTEGSRGWIFNSKACYRYGSEGIGLKIGSTSVMAPNGEAALAIDFENLSPKWSKRDD